MDIMSASCGKLYKWFVLTLYDFSITNHLYDVKAELALANDETPVGCVFVHDGEIIGRGMNDTNKSLNVRKALQNRRASRFDTARHI